MSQTVTVSEATPLSYPFLSQPPRQKKRPAPTCPLPSPPVGSTAPAFSLSLPGLPPATRAARSASSTISSWAAAVQPGSPSPLSPFRASYISSSITSIRIASASFISVTRTGEGLTADPSDPFKADFLIPDTPISPAPVPRSLKRNGYLNLSVAPRTPDSVQGKNVKRFRSLTSLRMGKRSVSGSSIPATPSSPAPPVPALPAPPRKATPTASSFKGKKAAKPVKTGPQALALHNEAALMQLLDGGSMRTNAQRVLDAEVSGTTVGQTAAYKDPNGALWRDADEALEFAHLLDGATLVCTGGTTDWVSFRSPSATSALSSAGNMTPGLLQQMPLTPLSPSMLALGQANGVLVPVSPASPQFSIFQVQRAGAVLAMPCRPRRSAERSGTEHLREAAFLLCTDSKEVEMARAAATLPTPVTPTSSTGKFKLPKVPAGKSRRARRRPAPLDLPMPSMSVQAVIPSAGADRADFLDASFEPTVRSSVPWAPGTPAVPPPNLPASHPLAMVGEPKVKKGLKGLFKRGGRS